ncbi:hypothetical protein [Hydrogenophaga sp.]|uniref:hypothetical protein n=1 Tax=Hydrogenophaga sp. TaxID=1904254 RepID=UPI002722EBC0|nr:hypothetical protein [Hydrogenophaga sp.]MDO9131904.1 hypothetical protein [Hydrogenophaga sp.]
MRLNKAQRNGILRVVENLAVAFVAIATFGYVGFGISAASAGVVLACALLLIVAALAIRGIGVSNED